MSPWLIAALVLAGVLIVGATIWLLYVGRRTVSAMLLRIDSRGWFSIGLFALSAAIFAMLAWAPTLKDNQLFATLAQAIIITGLINMAGGFNFGASKPNEKAPDKAP